jgi:uncharacterized small protein (DUF1192 family)
MTALAELAGMSRHMMERLLRESMLRFMRMGRVSLVPMTELEERVPTLRKFIERLPEAKSRGSARESEGKR